MISDPAGTGPIPEINAIFAQLRGWIADFLHIRQQLSAISDAVCGRQRYYFADCR
jgi:hypothetical protein